VSSPPLKPAQLAVKPLPLVTQIACRHRLLVMLERDERSDAGNGNARSLMHRLHASFIRLGDVQIIARLPWQRRVHPPQRRRPSTQPCSVDIQLRRISVHFLPPATASRPPALPSPYTHPPSQSPPSPPQPTPCSSPAEGYGRCPGDERFLEISDEEVILVDVSVCVCVRPRRSTSPTYISLAAHAADAATVAATHDRIISL